MSRTYTTIRYNALESNPNWLAALIDLCAVAFMLPIRRLWRLSRSRGPRTAGLPSSDATGDKETK